ATGITFLGSEVIAKKFELLREIIPTAKRIAVVVNPRNVATKNDAIKGAQMASGRLGLEIATVEASTETEIEMAFRAPCSDGPPPFYSPMRFSTPDVNSLPSSGCVLHCQSSREEDAMPSWPAR